MNLKSIEHNPVSSTIVDPWKKTAPKRYNDELLNPESEDRLLRLMDGPNWMRILPAKVSGSTEWLLAMHALDTTRGKFAHPRTLDPGKRCVWDNVYGHLYKTAPEKLYSKPNREGLRNSDSCSMSIRKRPIGGRGNEGVRRACWVRPPRRWG